MANIDIVASNGLKKVRSEKVEYAYGTLPGTSFADGDVLKIKTPSKVILSAVLRSGTVVVNVLNTSAAEIAAAVTGAGANDSLEYFVTYVRGSGEQTIAVTIDHV